MRNVFITGITKGIGKALAEKYLSEGCSVVGTIYGDNFNLTHINLQTIHLDLSSSDSIHNCIHEVEKLKIKFDIAINNAAILLDYNDTKIDIDILRKTLEVNLIGTIQLTELFLPYLENNAHIINISSTAGCLTDSNQDNDDEHPTYKISKTALNMYTRTLSVRLRKNSKIIVSSVHPGHVNTEMCGHMKKIEPKESALNIYDFSITTPPTGEFWYRGEKMPW